MAMLHRLDTGHSHFLASVTMIGRIGTCPICFSNTCILCLSHPEVSASHAELRWSRGVWNVRNLSNVNPTWIDDEPLPLGVAKPIRPGNVLHFGSLVAGRFAVDSHSPPRPLAVGVVDHLVLPGGDGYLQVGGERPWEVVSIGSSWELRRDQTAGPIHNGERVDATWHLHLPSHTETVGPRAPSCLLCTFVFEDPQGTGDWSLTIKQDGKTYDGGTYAPWRTLWALADKRADDERRGVAPREAGWMRMDEIADATGDTPANIEQHLNRRIVEYLSTKVSLPQAVKLQHTDLILKGESRRVRLLVEAGRIAIS